MSVDHALSFVVVHACIPARCLLLLPTPPFACFFCVLPVPSPPAPSPPSTNIVTPSLTPSATLKFNSEKFLFLEVKC